MGISKYKLLIILLMSLAITSDMNYSQDKKKSQQEQRSFSIDTPDEVYIHKPITLPDAAIKILRSSETGLICLKEYDHKFDPAWVVGSAVHLSAGETGIVVLPKVFKEPADTMPRNDCMLGAHTNTFWVLRKGDKGYQLLLETEASSLYVENSMHNGYLDITAETFNFSDTDAVYYRFDGRRYQEYKRKVTKR
jgi:hypothetical protein